MRLWIGHYYQDEKEWFLAWGKDKRDVWDNVNADGDSTRDFSSPGLINFHVDYDEQDSPTFSPSKNEFRMKNWLVLGSVGCSEEAADYMRRLRNQQIETSRKSAITIWLGSYLTKTEEQSLKGDESFIVWAKNKKEAVQFASEKMENVDQDTALFEITDLGFVNFHVSSRGGQVILTPPKEDLRDNVWINLRGVYATDSC